MQLNIETCHYFWIRHKTGIPFTRLVNLAGNILHEKIETMSHEEVEAFSKPYRIRTPARQHELDRRHGYVDDEQRGKEGRKASLDTQEGL